MKRYDGLINQCKLVSGPQDLGNLQRCLSTSSTTTSTPPRIPRKIFAPPQPPITEEEQAQGVVAFQDTTPMFKNELVIEPGAIIQPTIDALKKEAKDIEIQIRQIQVRF